MYSPISESLLYATLLSWSMVKALQVSLESNSSLDFFHLEKTGTKSIKVNWCNSNFGKAGYTPDVKPFQLRKGLIRTLYFWIAEETYTFKSNIRY